MTSVAFIGLGKMGLGMAASQARAGVEVQAYDLSSASMEAAEAVGCASAKSAAAAAAAASVIFTMLPAGAHVREVYFRDVLPNARPGTLLIDCSTIDVDTAREVSQRAESEGFSFSDAPVSGGTTAALAGTLTFMVGCHAEVFPAVEEVLKPMARAVIRAGQVGAGQVAKICNNMLLGISMIGTCEAFALAEKLGLDAERFFEIASVSSGQCWSLTRYCPVPGVGPETPAEHGYSGGFAAALMLKDLKLAQEAAARADVATPLGTHAAELYAEFSDRGYGEKDFSAILHFLRHRLQQIPLQGNGS
jgi:3-hydroxyisobutyrate dehydrogenase